jgi:transcriptional regulator with XRE-family HTH domain
MTFAEKTGNRLRDIRQKSGTKQKDLAKTLEIAPSLLSMYEQGKREPSITFVYKFTRFFNMTLSQFFTFDEIQVAQKDIGYSVIIEGLKDVLTKLESQNLRSLKEDSFERSDTPQSATI